MLATVATRRFTVDEYYCMAEAGIFAPGERVELIEGEIIPMAAIGSRHAEWVDRLNRLFVLGLGDRATVRVQNPVHLTSVSEPEPDIVVACRRPAGYAAHHPGPEDTILIVEVGDTTRALDRDVKGPLYAEAGIPEYWIVDLEEDRIDVHRRPDGGRYAEITRHGRGEVLRALAFPDLDVAVDDVLPPPVTDEKDGSGG